MNRKLLLAFVAIVGVGYLSYSLAYPTYTYRYKIIIEVETNDGVKTGSSVQEVKTDQFPAWMTLGNNTNTTIARGEAVFVDLGNGRNLVALLALGPNAQNASATTFAPRSYFSVKEGHPKFLTWAIELSKIKGDRRVFAGDMRPTIVTFSDLKVPTSIREVPFDNPASVLGSDVRQIRSWIEMTDEPVTWTLEAKLPWIADNAAARRATNIVTQDQPRSIAPRTVFRRK